MKTINLSEEQEEILKRVYNYLAFPNNEHWKEKRNELLGKYGTILENNKIIGCDLELE